LNLSSAPDDVDFRLSLATAADLSGNAATNCCRITVWTRRRAGICRSAHGLAKGPHQNNAPTRVVVHLPEKMSLAAVGPRHKAHVGVLRNTALSHSALIGNSKYHKLIPATTTSDAANRTQPYARLFGEHTLRTSPAGNAPNSREDKHPRRNGQPFPQHFTLRLGPSPLRPLSIRGPIFHKRHAPDRPHFEPTACRSASQGASQTES